MNPARNIYSVTSPVLGHISKTGSGPLAGAQGCEIMAEQSDFKIHKDQLGSFIAFLPPRHEVSWPGCDGESLACNELGEFLSFSLYFLMFCLDCGVP